jgi:hypothetical protein
VGCEQQLDEVGQVVRHTSRFASRVAALIRSLNFVPAVIAGGWHVAGAADIERRSDEGCRRSSTDDVGRWSASTTHATIAACVCSIYYRWPRSN